MVSFCLAGPLPTLDGITNEFKSSSSSSSPSRKGGGGGPGSPQIVVFPAVNEDQVREFKAAFWEAGPVNGFLSGKPFFIISLTSCNV